MRNKGFTLIELLVVMAIIAILAVIAIPYYNKYKANAFFGKMETNLKNAKAWAEYIYVEYDKYPNGTCPENSFSTGITKCLYDPNQDKIIKNSSGDLKVDAPFKIIFERENCLNGSQGVKITVECPAGMCSGLEPSSGTDAKIWINTCENPEVLHNETSLFK